MNAATLRRVGIALAFVLASLAARDPPFVPVRDPHASYLGIAIDAPGTDGWIVAEKREKTRWRVMYQHADPADASRTSAVFLKCERFKTGQFVRELGGLERLAQTSFDEGRQGNDPRLTEKLAELERDSVQGADAWRMRLVYEERDNPEFPGAVLLLEVVELFFLHPGNPDEIISVTASTRYRVGQKALSAGALLAPFTGAMRFE